MILISKSLSFLIIGRGGNCSTPVKITFQGEKRMSSIVMPTVADNPRSISGEQFDVKNEKTKGEEGAKFRQLLEDPEFEYDFQACLLICTYIIVN